MVSGSPLCYAFGVHDPVSSRRPRARCHGGLRSWRLLCSTVALAIAASAGIEAPLTLGPVEAAIDAVEVEEIVSEERRTQTGRRRIAERRPLDPSASVYAAHVDAATAMAAHASVPLERGSGRDRRHRHKSLVI